MATFIPQKQIRSVPVASLGELATTPFRLLPALPTGQYYDIISVAYRATAGTDWTFGDVFLEQSVDGTNGEDVFTGINMNSPTIRTLFAVNNREISPATGGTSLWLTSFSDPTGGTRELFIYLTYNINKIS